MRECPQKSKLPAKTDKPDKVANDSSPSINIFVREAGMYVEGTIEGEKVNILIDTGATISLLSTSVYQSLAKPPKLSKSCIPLATVSGSKLASRGSAKCSVWIGDTKRAQYFVVADIRSDAILGLDFLRHHGCAIDLSASTIRLGGKTFRCHTVGCLGICRVALDKTITIPESSEVIVSVPAITCSTSIDYVIEPLEKFKNSHAMLVARTFVRPNASAYVPVRIMNPNAEPKIVRAGTHIGWMEPAKAHEPVDKSNKTTLGTDIALTSHLQPLLKACSSNITDQQREYVAVFLRKYANLFAKGEHDMGRTDRIQHTTQTSSTPLQGRI